MNFAYKCDPALAGSMHERSKSQVVELPSGPAYYRAVGLKDASRNGWYLADAAELCDGFIIAPADTVVDVGCGDGGNLQFCARYAAHVIAVDINPVRLSDAERRIQAVAKGTYRAILSDANQLPIKSETADKVICTEVLEHVDDPAQVLGELVRIGKPGALYLLSVPDALSEHVAKRVAPTTAFQKPNHIRIIERGEFERMVTDAGLTVRSHSYRGFYWALFYALSWRCGVGLAQGTHPIMDHWAHVWNGVLDLPRGQDCKDALDRAMPKSQTIIAQKSNPQRDEAESN